MGYTAYLKPRKETISDEGVEGIIDIANLESGDKRKIEANPDAFFALSYPTADIKRVLDEINTRFNTDSEVSGRFLFEGFKGSGKSHLLLLVHNLFKHPEASKTWLSQNNLTCNVPDDAIVVINKFTDNPYDSLWELVFKSLGVKIAKTKTQPKLDKFEEALGNKNVVFIFDELEQGIKVIADPALQAQNIAFLQMLSEFSIRSKQVTLFSSIYSDKEEPGSTLKRVPGCTVQFDSTTDRCNVILHRLFENYLLFNPDSVSSVIEGYIQLWRKHVTIEDEEKLKKSFAETYPFTPSLIKIVLSDIPNRGSFQNVRGALSYLSNLVRITHETNDIISPADSSLEDRANVIMLNDIDIGGEIVRRANENVEELKEQAPSANKLASAVLLHTITGDERTKGVSLDNLTRDVITPSIDINEFSQTLMMFQKYASYFHTESDRVYFDIDEQPEAKVELKSLRYSDDAAIALIIDIQRQEIFRETTSSVVFTSVEQTKEILGQMDKNRLRYVITGRRLTQEERHNIYFGIDVRNLVILLEPKDDSYQLLNDKDTLKWAKRTLAAKALADGTQRAPQKADYERISRNDQSLVIERIKNAKLVFVSWEKYAPDVADDIVELEPIAGDYSKDKVLDALNQQYFPMLTIKEHLETRLKHIKDKNVKEIYSDYKGTLGYPIPVLVGIFLKAISELCKDKQIGIQHSRGNFCGKTPVLTDTELLNAQITAPFEETPTCPTCYKSPCECAGQPSECPTCGKSPCECGGTPPPICPTCGKSPCECAGQPPECPTCGKFPCECPKKERVSIKVPPQINIGSLRNEVASRLQDYEEAEIVIATYKIFFNKEDIGEISTLPASLRGNLSGQGDVSAEIVITKKGTYSKSQIEQQVESLPKIPDAEYSIDLTIEIEG